MNEDAAALAAFLAERAGTRVVTSSADDDPSDGAILLVDAGSPTFGEGLAAPARRALVTLFAGARAGELAAATGLAPVFTGSAPDGSPLVVLERPAGGLSPAASRTAPDGFRVVAILAAFNEADVILPAIRTLRSQGVEVHVIDNWSTDGTFELVEPLVGTDVIGLERFPAEGPTPTYQWARLLHRKEELAATLRADWFVHHDADEVRRSPWRGVGLREALAAVDRAGYDAVDHTCIDFVPVDDTYVPGTDFEEHFRHFRFGTRRGHFVRVNTWKRQEAPVDLAGSGGHNVRFPGRRVFPYKFLLKHYPIRSQAHGETKLFRERIARWDAEERRRGWHIQYDDVAPSASLLGDPRELLAWDGRFEGDRLVERLSGVGIPREGARAGS